MAKWSAEQFLLLFKNKHGERYDYSLMEFVNPYTKIKIICPDHGVFLQIPSNHRKAGCPDCKRDKLKKINTHDLATVLAKFKAVHGDRYDYSLVEYINQDTLVTIICPDHGEFKLTPAKHKKGRGCQTCGIARGIKLAAETKRGAVSPKRQTIEEFIKRAIDIHGKFYDYSLLKDYGGFKTKITIVCPDHGEFIQGADKHLMGRGCPHCKNRRQYSKNSENWLDSLGLDLIREYRIPEHKIRPVDGYDPVTNTIYQFHGDYWHGNPNRHPADELNKTRGVTFGELYRATLLADQKLRDYGYKLVVMWEGDWKASLQDTTLV